jgi:hypothetical protein
MHMPIDRGPDGASLGLDFLLREARHDGVYADPLGGGGWAR